MNRVVISQKAWDGLTRADLWVQRYFGLKAKDPLAAAAFCGCDQCQRLLAEPTTGAAPDSDPGGPVHA